jgi:hypothetical protein
MLTELRLEFVRIPAQGIMDDTVQLRFKEKKVPYDTFF